MQGNGTRYAHGKQVASESENENDSESAGVVWIPKAGSDPRGRLPGGAPELDNQDEEEDEEVSEYRSESNVVRESDSGDTGTFTEAETKPSQEDYMRPRHSSVTAER